MKCKTICKTLGTLQIVISTPMTSKYECGAKRRLTAVCRVNGTSAWLGAARKLKPGQILRQIPAGTWRDRQSQLLGGSICQTRFQGQEFPFLGVHQLNRGRNERPEPSVFTFREATVWDAILLKNKWYVQQKSGEIFIKLKLCVLGNHMRLHEILFAIYFCNIYIFNNYVDIE